MTIHVKTGGFEMIESISFLAYGLGETEVRLGGPGPERLCFLFNFTNPTDNKEPGLKFEPVDDHTVRVQLENWNNSLGMTITEPQEIGTYGGRKLLIAFAITKVGSKGETRHITLTFYAGEVAKDG